MTGLTKRGRRLRWLAIAAAGLALVALVIVSNMAGQHTGALVQATAPETHADRLRPYYTVHGVPENGGQVPVALLFSGCDGPSDNAARWADKLAEAGWASVEVDSHTPRGLDEMNLWRLVCSGQALPGVERAGDVAVAIADARALPFADPARIALVGASHGGWAVLDFLAFAGRGEVPPSLTEWPEGLAEDPLDGVVGAVMLYPYCGLLSEAGETAWQDRVPALFLLVEDDTITDEEACLDLVRAAEASGAPVEHHVYSGTTHGFDQQNKAPLSTLEFDPGATEDALRRIGDFLARVTSEGSVRH